MDLLQLRCELGPAVRYAFGLLGKPHLVELKVMLTLLCRLDLLAQLLHLGTTVIELRLRLHHSGAGGRDLRSKSSRPRSSASISRCRDKMPWISESAAWKLTLLRVNTWPCGHTMHGARRQAGTLSEALRRVEHHVYALQPILSTAATPASVQVMYCERGVRSATGAAVSGWAALLKEGDLAGRGLVEPGRRHAANRPGQCR